MKVGKLLKRATTYPGVANGEIKRLNSPTMVTPVRCKKATSTSTTPDITTQLLEDSCKPTPSSPWLHKARRLLIGTLTSTTILYATPTQAGNKACDDYYGYNCGVYNASTINYKQLVKNLYGVVFNPKTPFNEEQTKIVYDSLKLMSDSVLNNYGLTGSRWVKETFEGTMVSLGGWATKLFPGNSVTLSDEIQLASDLSS